MRTMAPAALYRRFAKGHTPSIPGSEAKRRPHVGEMSGSLTAVISLEGRSARSGAAEGGLARRPDTPLGLDR
jgi:hypothetical protein